MSGFSSQEGLAGGDTNSELVTKEGFADTAIRCHYNQLATTKHSLDNERRQVEFAGFVVLGEIGNEFCRIRLQQLKEIGGQVERNSGGCFDAGRFWGRSQRSVTEDGSGFGGLFRGAHFGILNSKLGFVVSFLEPSESGRDRSIRSVEKSTTLKFFLFAFPLEGGKGLVQLWH